jgi:4-hydroxybenzoate polyprenyltransferase
MLPQSQLTRLVRCIRWADVLILQGAPILGVAFSIGPFASVNLPALVLFCAGSFLLVTHIFTFNDWAESVQAADNTDSSSPVIRLEEIRPPILLSFSFSLLATSLVLFAFLSLRLFSLAVLIAASGIFYSHPSLNAKTMPIFSTLLHLAGESLYFLLGYALFSSIDLRGVLIGLFFGITFAAGHLVQEVRDFDEDRQFGARTNAIVFGPRRNFFAGAVLFTVQYLYLFGLAWSGLIPRLLVFLPIVFFPIHIIWTIQTLRRGLNSESITRFQNRYRILYVLIGLTMLLSALVRY